MKFKALISILFLVLSVSANDTAQTIDIPLINMFDTAITVFTRKANEVRTVIRKNIQRTYARFYVPDASVAFKVFSEKWWGSQVVECIHIKPYLCKGSERIVPREKDGYKILEYYMVVQWQIDKNYDVPDSSIYKPIIAELKHWYKNDVVVVKFTWTQNLGWIPTAAGSVFVNESIYFMEDNVTSWGYILTPNSLGEETEKKPLKNPERDQ